MIVFVCGQPVHIRTNFVYPPIPIRYFDWSAVTVDYEPGHPHGRGRTESAAIDDLILALEEEYETDEIS